MEKTLFVLGTSGMASPYWFTLYIHPITVRITDASESF